MVSLMIMEGYPIRKGYPFYVTLKILNFFYIYPWAFNRMDLTKFKIVCVLLKIIIVFFFMGSALHLWMVIKENIALDISEDMSTLVGGIGAILTCILTSVLHKQWSRFLMNLVDCTRFGEPPSFNTTTKRVNLLSISYIIYCCVGTLLYALVAFMDASDCKKVAEEIGKRLVCGTVIPVWLTFNINTIAVMILLILLVLCIVPPSGTIYFLCFEAAEFLISHIDHDKGMILEVFKEQDVGRRIKKMRTCLQYHQHIIRLAKELNGLMKRNIGHMTVIWAISFGCIGNEIFSSKALPGFIFLGGYIVALFCVCHAGQRLSDESLSLADNLYDSKWYYGTAREQKIVLYMLAKCQIPLTLNTFPCGIYQYSLFVLMLKTGYSYLTLLRNST